MKKKNNFSILIVILLAATVAYFYSDRKKTTIKEELRDFAVEDTSAITKIFLADKSNNMVTLHRNSASQWMVNGKYTARKDLIQTLLTTIKDIEIKSPVANAAHNNIVKQLAASAVKIEIYLNKDTKPGKVYYVGGGTQNNMGTYMLLEGSSAPFITHLSYFYGYLTPRYTTDVLLWRDKTIFNTRFADITSVRAEIPNAPESSFEINNIGAWSYTLSRLSTRTLEKKFDTSAVKIYLTNFRNIQFEDFTGSDKQFVDSVKTRTPLYIISLGNNSGEKTTVTMYSKRMPPETYDMSGNLIEDDPDRMYAVINNSGELVTVQFFVFDVLMRRIEDFL